jgi:acetyl-CoA C-acetyltransferase
MSQKVAIVDVVQSKHSERLEDNIREIVFELVKELMDHVGIDRSEIGSMISSSSDYFLGTSCSNSYYYDAAGANLKSGSKTPEDSALAFIYGLMRILSGEYKTVLVVSITKCSEVPSVYTLTNLMADPFFQRPIGLNEAVTAGLQAREYMDRYGLTNEQLARVVIKNLANAQKNPYTHRSGEFSINDILSSPMMVYPLREMDIASTSDGACAMLLATEEIARSLTDTPVFVEGVGWSVNSTFLCDQDLLNGTLPKAAEMAYRMAGIKDPLREIDVAEICDTTSFNEILWLEQLGFCSTGKGGQLIDEGVTTMSGKLPVNPSGGLLGANPYVARGLIRIAEAALQLKGEAGNHQVANVSKGLAHSVHGLGGQLHSVVILGK